jgi:hypothetical protein
LTLTVRSSASTAPVERCLAAALENVFGTAGPIDSYAMAGKTDALMVYDFLGAAGFPPAEIERRLEAVYEEMAWQAPATFLAL